MPVKTLFIKESIIIEKWGSYTLGQRETVSVLTGNGLDQHFCKNMLCGILGPQAVSSCLGNGEKVSSLGMFFRLAKIKWISTLQRRSDLFNMLKGIVNLTWRFGNRWVRNETWNVSQAYLTTELLFWGLFFCEIHWEMAVCTSEACWSSGAPGWLGSLSVCLRFGLWSWGPGIQPSFGLSAQ